MREVPSVGQYIKQHAKQSGKHCGNKYVATTVSLSSAGLQQLLSICDQYCAMRSITFNVKKSVCMFFRCSVNKTCDITNVV